MPSLRRRRNQQQNSEHPVPQGRPPKCRAGTSQNPNQRQNHLVLSNQVPSIDNPHGGDNLQPFSVDQLETLRTMIEDKVAESSRDISTEAARAAVTALWNQTSVAVVTTPQRDTNRTGATNPPRHTTSKAIQIHFGTTLSHHNCKHLPSPTKTSLRRT